MISVKKNPRSKNYMTMFCSGILDNKDEKNQYLIFTNRIQP